MKPDVLRLLKEFELPQTVEAACRITFGQSRHFAVPAMIKQSIADGLLQVLDCDGPVKDTPAIYGRDLMLTDKGRDTCGFQRVEPAKQKPKKAVAKSLFD